MKTIIAIDPGINGGIVVGNENEVKVFSMPDGYTSIFVLLKKIKDEKKDSSVITVMEDVGHGIPGQSSKATATFAKHIGHLEMAMFALSIPLYKVTPQKWQKYYSNTVGSSKGLDKSTWKNKLKTLAMTLYPDKDVTLKTADALLLYDYAVHNNL